VKVYMHKVNAIEIVLKNIERKKFKHWDVFFSSIERERNGLSFFEIRTDLLKLLGMHTNSFFKAKKDGFGIGYKYLDDVHEEYEHLVKEIEKLEKETRERLEAERSDQVANC